MFNNKNLKDSLNDGMFEPNEICTHAGKIYSPKWPFYIENTDHPFLQCRVVDRVKMNKFANTDSYDRFQENLLTQPTDWRYRTKDIIYNINASGYRTREWKDIDWKESIVIFGDSCTFGIGLSEDETISYKLEELTGRPTINLGCPGLSNLVMVQNLSTLMNKFPSPYAVIMNWSTPDRIRYFAKDHVYDCGSWDISFPIKVDDVDLKDFYLTNCYDENHIMCLNYFYGSMAKSMVNSRSKYITLSYFESGAYYTRAEKCFNINFQARDLIHPGNSNSEEIANYIKERLS